MMFGWFFKKTVITTTIVTELKDNVLNYYGKTEDEVRYLLDKNQLSYKKEDSHSITIYAKIYNISYNIRIDYSGEKLSGVKEPALIMFDFLGDFQGVGIAINSP